jgi:ribosomal protein L11 methyltransferase
VLAIAAAKLGWAPVLACDIDQAALAATRAGAAANGVAVEISGCDVRHGGGPWAPTVLANLVGPLLLDLAATLERPPERLIMSGLQLPESGEVVAAFARHGLREVARRERRDWAAIRLDSRP